MVQPGPDGRGVVNIFFAANPSPDGETGKKVNRTPVGKVEEEPWYWSLQATSVTFKFA